jgi:UDP-2,3-diacylglucosamine hydrolase
LSVDGNRCERWVLPDWDCDHLESGEKARGGWMVIDEDGPSLFDLDHA